MSQPQDGRPTLGSRVVMRYLLPEGYGRSMTDVIGELVSLEPPTVRAADGQLISVAPTRVVAMKALGPRPIRTSDIRALEATAAHSWPGVEHEWVDGWLLRSGYGYTNRANSAVPLGNFGAFSSSPSGGFATAGFATTATVTLDRISRWYADRDLTPTLVLPDRIVPIPPGWRTYGESQVMAVDLGNVMLPEGPSIVSVDPTPNRGWFEMYCTHDPRAVASPAAAEVLTTVHNGILGFASLGDSPNPDFGAHHGIPLAIARGSITDAPDGRRWIGLGGVEVAEAHRRHGLGTLICAELLRWGRSHGATHAYVQVAVQNTPAIATYRSLGFVDHHRYRYTMPPGANT